MGIAAASRTRQRAPYSRQGRDGESGAVSAGAVRRLKQGPHSLRQSGRRSVRPLPPLSWTLRDSPEPRPGLTPSVSGRSPAALQSALPPAVLLPESFRGGCSFGAAPTRDLSCGRVYSAACLAPTGAED